MRQLFGWIPVLLVMACGADGGAPDLQRATVLDSIRKVVTAGFEDADWVFVVSSDDCWSCMRLGRALRLAARDSSHTVVVAVPETDSRAVRRYMSREKAHLPIISFSDHIGYDSRTFGGPVFFDAVHPGNVRVFDRSVIDVHSWLTSSFREE